MPYKITHVMVTQTIHHSKMSCNKLNQSQTYHIKANIITAQLQSGGPHQNM